jgi:hypothetical protein
MPIRFRCEHCHQLLGIARRKAGSRVECPTCHARVLVPATDTTAAPSGGAAEPLFERSDFDKVLQVPVGNEPSVLANPPGPKVPAPQPAQPRSNGPLFGDEAFDVERVQLPAAPAPDPGPLSGAIPGGGGALLPPPPPAGYVLTPGRATLLTTLGILLLALAFGAGLYVGRYLL